LKSKLTVVLMLLANAAPAVGQSGAEDVVRAFFKAEDEGRWLDAARMLDLNSFEGLRRDAVNRYRSVRTFPVETAERIRKLQPDMPLAVAEYQARQMNEQRSKLDPLEEEFARVGSVDSLIALPTDEAAARWLEATGPEWKEAVSIKRYPHARPMVDCPGLPDSVKKMMLREQFKTDAATILGSTGGSDSVRHVVVAEGFGGLPKAIAAQDDADLPMSPRAITVKNVSGSWKIVPRRDMPQSNGMLGSVSFGITCVRDSASKAGART
jgi:hypothetical protein